MKDLVIFTHVVVVFPRAEALPDTIMPCSLSHKKAGKAVGCTQSFLSARHEDLKDDLGRKVCKFCGMELVRIWVKMSVRVRIRARVSGCMVVEH